MTQEEEKSKKNSLRRAQNRKNRIANLSDEDKKHILNHPFVRGIFTEEANKKRNQLFIESLGKRVAKYINS